MKYLLSWNDGPGKAAITEFVGRITDWKTVFVDRDLTSSAATSGAHFGSMAG
jgi:hypothetical protein